MGKDGERYEKIGKDGNRLQPYWRIRVFPCCKRAHTPQLQVPLPMVVMAGVRFVLRFCFCFVVCFCVCGLIYRKGEGCLFMCVKVKMFYDGLGRTNTQKGLAPFKTACVHTDSNPAPRAIPKGSEKLVFEEFSLKA